MAPTEKAPVKNEPLPGETHKGQDGLLMWTRLQKHQTVLNPYKEALGGEGGGRVEKKKKNAWDVIFKSALSSKGVFVIIDLTNRRLMIFICLSIP